MSSVHELPYELLLAVFESIRDTNQRIVVLLSAARVCRTWGKAAGEVLRRRLEITQREDALTLIQAIQRTSTSSPNGPYIETLSLGVGGDREPTLINNDLFQLLLAHTPRIRKLVILHQNSFCLDTTPLRQLDLPHLRDVTITAAGNTPAGITETALIRQLPNSIEFLHLPGTERTRFIPPETPPPSFHLRGLTLQDYPTATSKWLEQSSSDTLEFLTTTYMGRLDQCAANLPNLRSLRILGRLSNSAGGFSRFGKLERLEIREPSVKQAVIDTLPPSLKLIRFWALDVATTVARLLAAGRLPNLKTAVWDHYRPTGGPVQAIRNIGHDSAARKLTQACEKYGVELKIFERVDGGRRAGEGKDIEYETYLIDLFGSCKINPELRLPTRILQRMHAAGLTLAPQFKSISPFVNNVPGQWPGIWEDCFAGHGEWLEKTLPKLIEERKG